MEYGENKEADSRQQFSIEYRLKQSISEKTIRCLEEEVTNA
jgi:hypothetical protein